MPILPPIKKSQHKKKNKKGEKDKKSEKDKKKKKKESEKKKKDKKPSKKEDKDEDTKKPEEKKDDEQSKIKVFMNTSPPPNVSKGIIDYLTTKAGENIHQNGMIEVQANSQLTQTGLKNRYSPQYVVNKMGITSNLFYAAEKGQTLFWLCFDFKSMRVEISGYAIRNTQYANVANIRNWVFEISDDNQNWTQIDNQSDCQLFKTSSATGYFSATSSRFVRYCRFRHTGEFWNPKFNTSKGGSDVVSNSYVGIQCIEFYGKLKEA